MNPHDPEKLERLIHQTLRSLPNRRAPNTLEARVLAALAERAALPWWRQAFTAWPVAARISFMVLSLAVAGGVVLLCIYGGTGVRVLLPALGETFAPLAMIKSAVLGTADFCLTVFRAISPLYLYGTLALFVALYGALFGLGAAAYRAFQTQR